VTGWWLSEIDVTTPDRSPWPTSASSVFYDVDTLRPGDPFPDRIRKEMVLHRPSGSVLPDSATFNHTAKSIQRRQLGSFILDPEHHTHGRVESGTELVVSPCEQAHARDSQPLNHQTLASSSTWSCTPPMSCARGCVGAPPSETSYGTSNSGMAIATTNTIATSHDHRLPRLSV
jgi:hypothetical protein